MEPFRLARELLTSIPGFSTTVAEIFILRPACSTPALPRPNGQKIRDPCGLALIGALTGHPVIVVAADTTSQEKLALLRAAAGISDSGFSGFFYAAKAGC
jgi:hypothetical protein